MSLKRKDSIVRDAWQPTADDVREWAFSTSDPWSDHPCEDWPLALAWSRHEIALLELASDDSCPSREFMVFVLYFAVGHAVHQDFKSVPKAVIEGFVRRGVESTHQDVQCWTQCCWNLLQDTDKFNYQHWCGGQYANIAT